MNHLNQLVLNTMAVATLSEIMIIGLIVFSLVSIYMHLMVEGTGHERWKKIAIELHIQEIMHGVYHREYKQYIA